MEVHFRGVWSTVCDSQWYQPEADVLCRALGCGCMADRPPGQPHSLPGRMFYSCDGDEATPFLCTWRFNNSNLCSQSRAARVICSGTRTPGPRAGTPGPLTVRLRVDPALLVPEESWTGHRQRFCSTPGGVLSAGITPLSLCGAGVPERLQHKGALLGH